MAKGWRVVRCCLLMLMSVLQPLPLVPAYPESQDTLLFGHSLRAEAKSIGSQSIIFFLKWPYRERVTKA